MPEHRPREGYDGPAVLRTDRTPLEVQVRLRGHFEPIDGRFHWWGRIAADPALGATVGSGAAVRVETPYGDATGRLCDLDPWGRFRVVGAGRPPF